MPGPVYNSIVEIPGDGVTTQHEFNFAGGYISRTHVKARITTALGSVTEIAVVDGMFVNDYTLNLGVAAPVGATLRIYRETPRDVPLANFAGGARITEANLDLMTQQAIFAVAEAFDLGGYAAVNDLLEQAGLSAASAEAAALTAAADALEATEAADAAVAAAALMTAPNGAGVVGFVWAPLPAAINKVDWGLHTARSGISILRFMLPAHWPAALDGTSTEDLTYAFDAAMSHFLGSPGGVLQIPAGQFSTSTTVACATSGVEIAGSGPRATIVRHTGLSHCFTFESTHFSGVSNLQIIYTAASTGFAVRFIKTGATGCFFGFVRNVYIVNSYNGIDILTATETRVHGVHLRSLRGEFGVHFHGTGSGTSASYRAVLTDIVCDTAGNGNITIKWVCHDSWAYSLVVSKVTGLYGGIGLVMQDTALTGTSYPVWCYCDDLEADHSEVSNVVLLHGEGFYCTHSWLGSTATGSGLLIGPLFRGEVAVGGTRIMGCAQSGVVINAGPVKVRLYNNMIGDNGVSAPGTHHGVVVASGASEFSIVDNVIGNLPGVAGNAQGYGVFLVGGASTNYVITGNDLTGNTTGGLSDSTTGTAGIIKDNLGYQPAPANVTVTASPMVYRAGHTPETLFVKGGTVAAIQSLGGVVYYLGVTNVGVPLAPNQEVVIIYSVAPTMSRLPQ